MPFFTQQQQICYSSKQTFENPTANLNALCKPCAKILYFSWDFRTFIVNCKKSVISVSQICYLNIKLNLKLNKQ